MEASNFVVGVGRTESILEPRGRQKNKRKIYSKLIDFEYGCYYEYEFYKFRFAVLGSLADSRFKNNDWKNYLINWLIKIGVGWWNSENNEWQYYLL